MNMPLPLPALVSLPVSQGGYTGLPRAGYRFLMGDMPWGTV